MERQSDVTRWATVGSGRRPRSGEATRLADLDWRGVDAAKPTNHFYASVIRGRGSEGHRYRNHVPMVVGRHRVRLEGRGEPQPAARKADQLFHDKRVLSSSCPHQRRQLEGEKTAFLGRQADSRPPQAGMTTNYLHTGVDAHAVVDVE